MIQHLCVIGPQLLRMKKGERAFFSFSPPYACEIECIYAEEDSSESTMDLAPLVSVSIVLNQKRAYALGDLRSCPSHGLGSTFALQKPNDPVLYDEDRDGVHCVHGPRIRVAPPDLVTVVLCVEETKEDRSLTCAIGFGYRRR